MEGIVIRKIKTKDIDKVAQIAMDSYVEMFGDEMEKEDLDYELEKRNSKYFSKTKNNVLVAIIENNIIGFIEFGAIGYKKEDLPKNVEIKESDIELNKIYIDADYRGKGVGKKLIQEMINIVQKSDVNNIYLDVYGENKRAVKTYNRMGFKEVGQIPFTVDGEVKGFDILMRKEIEK
jgi:ribosomal protein S18 acetylase RimI-like enzyme